MVDATATEMQTLALSIIAFRGTFVDQLLIDFIKMHRLDEVEKEFWK